MAGLVPAIHAVGQSTRLVYCKASFAQPSAEVLFNRRARPDVDGRDKPGHDGVDAA
jgi:hypothetical protein